MLRAQNFLCNCIFFPPKHLNWRTRRKLATRNITFNTNNLPTLVPQSCDINLKTDITQQSHTHSNLQPNNYERRRMWSLPKPHLSELIVNYCHLLHLQQLFPQVWSVRGWRVQRTWKVTKKNGWTEWVFSIDPTSVASGMALSLGSR